MIITKKNVSVLLGRHIDSQSVQIKVYYLNRQICEGHYNIASNWAHLRDFKLERYFPNLNNDDFDDKVLEVDEMLASLIEEHLSILTLE